MEFTQAGIILRTENYQDCASFYRDTLCLPVLFELDRPGSVLTSFDLGGTYLMVEPDGPKASDQKSLDQSPVTLRFNVADLEKTATTLESRGVAVNRREFEWGAVADFVDPEGNRCQLRSEKGFGV